MRTGTPLGIFLACCTSVSAGNAEVDMVRNNIQAATFLGFMEARISLLEPANREL